jgi:hypothetical protein
VSAKSTRNRRRKARQRQSEKLAEQVLLAIGGPPPRGQSQGTSMAWSNSPRCSMAKPCEVYNPLHSALYGECYHLRASDDLKAPSTGGAPS